MKTTIEITGQISGNITLKNAISTWESEDKKGMFYGYSLTFPTKKAAHKALWEAYKALKLEEPKDWNLRYSPKRALYYDASKAVIVDN